MQNSFPFENAKWKWRDLHINSVPFCDFHDPWASPSVEDDRRHMTPYGQFRRKMTCATMCYIVLQCATFGSRIRVRVIGTFTRENPFSS